MTQLELTILDVLDDWHDLYRDEPARGTTEGKLRSLLREYDVVRDEEAEADRARTRALEVPE